MKTLIFDFKSKAVGAVGGSAVLGRAYKDILAAQRKVVANSPTTAAKARQSS